MNLLNLTLLYVEDEKETREIFGDIFRHMVSKVFIAANADEALQIFRQEKIHFVISDFKMPGMNGAELCSAIKKIDPLTQFILLTAYNDTNILLDSIDAGVDKYLQKPINKTKLFETLEETRKNLFNKFQLERTNQLLQETQNLAKIAYWEVDLLSKKITFSEDVAQLFGLEKKDDLHYKELLKYVAIEDRDSFRYLFEKELFNSKEIDKIFKIHKNNKVRYIRIIIKEWESLTYGTTNLLALFQDVSHYEMQKIKLLQENLTDPMLQIANRRMITLELENLIKSAQRYKHSLCVLFFDIDNFKKLNDTHGHLLADEILKELTTLVQQNIRSSDLFGRWGGDEFVIITGYSNIKESINLAKKLLSKAKEHNWQNGINVGISIGLACFKEGDTPESLLERADQKMLEAKHNGKHQCRS